MAGTVRLYVTSTLANYLHRSPSQRACRGGMYGLVGVYGRPGPLAGLLACFLSHVHLAPSSHFRSSHANAASRCLRTALLRSPYLLPSLSLSLPFPSVSFSCVLPSHRSSISVVGSLCLLCVWVVGFGYTRRRRRRERESTTTTTRKGGKFLFVGYLAGGCFWCGKNSSGFMSDHDIQIPGAFGASFFFFLLKPSFCVALFLGVRLSPFVFVWHVFLSFGLLCAGGGLLELFVFFFSPC